MRLIEITLWHYGVRLIFTGNHRIRKKKNSSEPKKFKRVALGGKDGVLPLVKGKANEVCEGKASSASDRTAIRIIATSNPLATLVARKKQTPPKGYLLFYPWRSMRILSLGKIF